jgi:hypothetical protein
METGESEKRSANAGRLLAIVPIGVALILTPLIVPRSATPDSVPVPIVDARAFARTVVRDRELAERGRREGLPDDLRALGTALREFHAAEARDEPAVELSKRRAKLDTSLRAALKSADLDAFARMRAVQLESFLAEVRRFDKTGEESNELVELAGSFVRRMRREGWVRDHTIDVDESVLRVLFKQMWSTLLALDGRAEMAATLDEQRTLYAFYIARPHAPDVARDAVNAARRGARDRAACDALDSGERMAAEAWRLERIARLAAIDPDYPAAYARGVVLYRRGNYVESISAFEQWLHDHPDGPWSLRAKNYVRAAHAAAIGAGKMLAP